jgi:hydroxyacylglutathione hydrolase
MEVSLMFVEQFFVKGLAHSSYLLGGSGICAIVDPRRDVQIYLDAAKELQMEITHILETHLHADFVSGHLDLAEKTGARIYAPKSGGCAFDHVGLVKGDKFEIEDMLLEVLLTPGHTPEHIAYVVTDKARGNEPAGLFSGDTLFVGDVGRPDLFPGQARELASQLYDSLHDKLLRLPDSCAVYPAHGAGSLCGRAMGAMRTSTIGYERKYNAALAIEDRDEFIKSLTTDMPGAPDHFGRCSAINGKGPALVRQLPVAGPVEPAAFRKAADKEDTLVLDVRAYESFGGQHVPGAWHVDFGGNFATFAGWVLPPEQEILLVVDSAQQAADAAVWLRRVGLDRVVGYLEGGMFAWSKAGFPAAHVGQLSPQEVRAMATGKEKLQLVDVRTPPEFERYHVDGAINISAPEVRTRHNELDPSLPVVTVCGTGHRSSMAASILKQNGFERVMNAAGGMTGYAAAGLGRDCPMCVGSHGPRFLGKGLA